MCGRMSGVNQILSTFAPYCQKYLFICPHTWATHSFTDVYLCVILCTCDHGSGWNNFQTFGQLGAAEATWWSAIKLAVCFSDWGLFRCRVSQCATQSWMLLWIRTVLMWRTAPCMWRCSPVMSVPSSLFRQVSINSTHCNCFYIHTDSWRSR